jgi:DNA polymerase-4
VSRAPVNRRILLVDMDAFFASVEQAHHPHLQGQPVIVCGDPSRRGVVTAASYEARPSGVHAGMPLQEARRLCPGAHYVEGDPEKYVAISLALLNLYL